MTKREKILAAIKVAAYEGDEKTVVRLLVENRISYQTAMEAARLGRKIRANKEVSK